MTLEELQSTTLSSSQTNCNQVPKQMTISSKAKLCQVCGSPARFVNYGALTCQSCRAFFRRHGGCSKVVRPCHYDRQCEMNAPKRKQRICIACRLAKCLSVGMSGNYIRNEANKIHECHSTTEVKNTEVALLSPQISVSQIPTLDLLNGSRSDLNTSQWILLSNVVRAYDTFSSVSHMDRIIRQLSQLSIQHPSARYKSIEAVELIVASIQSFVRSIPDFQILTISEQSSLLERNLHGIAGFDSGLVFRNSGVIDDSRFLAEAIKLYGFEAMCRTKRLENRLDPDSTLVKLMLVIFAFSSNCLILNVPKNMHNDSLLLGTFRLFGSQNVYVELLWKYMIYRYGYRETVIRFASLVKQVLDVIDHLAKVYVDSQVYQTIIDNDFDRNKPSFITNLNEHIPLWGNT